MSKHLLVNKDISHLDEPGHDVMEVCQNEFPVLAVL